MDEQDYELQQIQRRREFDDELSEIKRRAGVNEAEVTSLAAHKEKLAKQGVEKQAAELEAKTTDIVKQSTATIAKLVDLIVADIVNTITKIYNQNTEYFQGEGVSLDQFLNTMLNDDEYVKNRILGTTQSIEDEVVFQIDKMIGNV